MAGIILQNDSRHPAHPDYKKAHESTAKTESNKGPTVEEYVKAGYDPKNYPPPGFTNKSTADEIAKAVAAYKPATK